MRVNCALELWRVLSNRLLVTCWILLVWSAQEPLVQLLEMLLQNLPEHRARQAHLPELDASTHLASRTCNLEAR